MVDREYSKKPDTLATLYNEIGEKKLVEILIKSSPNCKEKQLNQYVIEGIALTKPLTTFRNVETSKLPYLSSALCAYYELVETTTRAVVNKDLSDEKAVDYSFYTSNMFVSFLTSFHIHPALTQYVLDELRKDINTISNIVPKELRIDARSSTISAYSLVFSSDEIRKLINENDSEEKVREIVNRIVNTMRESNSYLNPPDGVANTSKMVDAAKKMIKGMFQM